jgi:fibronectin type 3 domain-containing protein
MTLSAYPAVINTNAPGMTSEQSLIKVIVRDASDNLVMGKAVDFSIIQDASAGALAKASGTTDMYGTATTNYIAGSVTGGANNVVIRSTVQDTPTVTATTTLTVGGQALFISLATGQTIQKIEPNKYQRDYIALVTDTGGGPVANAVVTATVTPQYYMKGYYYICGESWCQMKTLASSKSTAPLVPACANEDGMLQNSLYDFNGILDTDPVTGNSEDQNANNRLDPGNVVSVTAATTDSSGHSTVSLTYAQDYAFWVNVKLEVRASLAGSTTRAFQSFDLPGLAKDYTDKTITPPGNPSPFGSNTTCYPDFSVLAVSDTKISMNWDPSAYAVSYNIYRDPNNVLLQGLLASTTKTTYEDSPVTAGTTYCYEIKQVNASGVESPLSPVSNRVCASSQPKAPTVTTTTLSASQIQISWTDAGATGGYRIYRDNVAIKDSVTRTVIDSGLNANTRYCYAVTSLDSAGVESSKSSTVCATTAASSLPTTPAITAITSTVAGQVDLTWAAQVPAPQGYKIYANGAFSISAPGTASSVTGVVETTGTVACFAVSAFDLLGNESAQSTQACISVK